MKRLLFIVAAVIGMMAVVAMALPLVISSDAVRQSLIERAREITGREMTFSGDPSVSFSPFLGIEIQNVVFRDPFAVDDAPPILSMPELRAELSLASALKGNIVISHFRFIRPEFHLKIYSTGQTSWTFPQGKVWKTLAEGRMVRDNTLPGEPPDIGAISNVSLGTFSVSDGMIVYDNAITGTNETVTNFNGTLSWPDIRSAWKFSGNGIWRGDVFNLVSTAEQPIMLLAGGNSNITAEISSEPLNIRFTGDANRFADLYWNGRVELTSPSLRRVINLLGGAVEPGSTFSNFSASGNISGTIDQFQLKDAALSLDGNKGTGSFGITQTATGTARISGTLAYSSFDAAPYLLALKERATGERSGASLLGLFRETALDLRLSSAKVILPESEFRNFAGGILASDGRMMIDIGNANLDDGLLVGSVEAEDKPHTMALAANLNLSRIDPSQLPYLKNVIAVRPAGRSNIRIKLASWGEDVDTLAGNLEGSFQLAMARGVLRGLNFSAIRASLVEPNGSSDNIRIGLEGGETPVSDLELDIPINRGVAHIQQCRFSVGDFSAELWGKADLRLGNLAIWGNLKTAKETPPTEQAGAKQFFLGGTLRQPLFVPEVFAGFPGEERPRIPSSDDMRASPSGAGGRATTN